MSDIKPETPVEEALAAAAEKIIAAVAAPGEMKVRHTIATVLKAYEFMRNHGSHSSPAETQVVLSIASECKGLVLWMNGMEVVGMASFWPTSNPNVPRNRTVPELDADGQYLYFDWGFTVGDWKQWRRVVQYAAETYQDARFVCCHDCRRRVKGNRVRGSGRLLVRKIQRPPVTLKRMLGLNHG